MDQHASVKSLIPRLDDQVAVITGGGGGIGRAIALAFAELGADIVILEHIPERCEEVAERIREIGRDCLSIPTDVRDTEQIRSAIVQAANRFGRIDILVNNAGGTANRSFLEQSESNWRRSIDLNLVSMLAATSAAVPTMIAGGRGGAVLNVASIEGSRAAPGYAVYAACKAGMLNFTRSAALEFAHHGIRVNAIAPDYTLTPGVRGNITGAVDPQTWMDPGDAHEAASSRRIPLGRLGIDRECAAAAAFLVSPMSSYITGVTLPVDGGTWASSGWTRGAEGDWVLTNA